MDDKQKLAFLEAKVEILERNQDKTEKRLDKQEEDRKKFEETIDNKLDLLIHKSKFQDGVLKALLVIAPLIGVVLPILIKLSPFLKNIM